ncbi:MAG: site-2 protease family protein [Fimbriiglobus sp.]
MDAKLNPTTQDTPTKPNWWRENGYQLVLIAIIMGVIFRYLHPFDVFLAGFGLSFIIFIHELGHFVAAKLCDVHVKTFSIGFGPALPFCSFKYGETTYKLALIPLGGFVAMAGEADGNNMEVGTDEPEDAAEDPRNLKNKPVWQRMIIVSAGVFMNIVLSSILFIVTYMHGVEESPGIMASVETGSAAWKAGIHSGTKLDRLNSRQNPWFDDIKPMVFSTTRSETVSMDIDYAGEKKSMTVEPFRIEGGLAPQLGVLPLESTTLRFYKRDPLPPYIPGSLFGQAKSADGQGFQPGDKIVGMTDPDPSRSQTITAFDPKHAGLPGSMFDMLERQRLLQGKPITYQVQRRQADGTHSGPTVDLVCPPSFRWDLGLRMRMGEITAIRTDSPAEKAELQARTPDYKKTTVVPGDTIVAVEVPEASGSTRFTTDPTEATPTDPKTTVRPLDPMRLPHELESWLTRPASSRKVKVTVLRTIEHGPQRKTVEMDWDNRYSREYPLRAGPGTPVAINGLGLGYQVLAIVTAVEPHDASERLKPVAERKAPSAAAKAGLQPNDKIKAIQYFAVDHQGTELPGKFQDIEPHYWNTIDTALQRSQPYKLGIRFERDGQDQEVVLQATQDLTWPTIAIGLDFAPETVVQKADGVFEALQMGAYRTYRGIRMTYQGMYGIVFGDVSFKSLSGPITLGRISYLIAGQDIWHLLIWLSMISINLAVVNFMPVPVLDGGHMVFLTYEAIVGKRPPETVEVILTYMGLACVGCLMLFVFGLDIWRYFFQ